LTAGLTPANYFENKIERKEWDEAEQGSNFVQKTWKLMNGSSDTEQNIYFRPKFGHDFGPTLQ